MGLVTCSYWSTFSSFRGRIVNGLGFDNNENQDGPNDKDNDMNCDNYDGPGDAQEFCIVGG